jgi:hypothetical protein
VERATGGATWLDGEVRIGAEKNPTGNPRNSISGRVDGTVMFVRLFFAFPTLSLSLLLEVIHRIMQPVFKTPKIMRKEMASVKDFIIGVKLIRREL